MLEQREMLHEELQLLYALPVDPKVKEAPPTEIHRGSFHIYVYWRVSIKHGNIMEYIYIL